MNALLASSVRVQSSIRTDAFQRAAVSLSVSRIGVSLCHAGRLDTTAYEVISAGLKDTTVTLTTRGNATERALDVTVATSFQVYVQNFVQLLNVSVLPPVSVHAMVHSSVDRLIVSTVVDPIALYLNHTVLLILATIDKIVTAQPAEPVPTEPATATPVEEETALLLHDMRITVVNEADRPVWYRQEGTSERLCVEPRSRAAYSWLSLASDVYYRMEFALEEEKGTETNEKPPRADNEQASSVGDQAQRQASSVWSDPCVVKENCVTGRYFKQYGFLWVCVELRGLQTLVTLRPAVLFRNWSGRSVHLRLNDDTHATFVSCGQPEDLKLPVAKSQLSEDTSVGGAERDTNDKATVRHSGDKTTLAIMTDVASRARVSLSGSMWSSPLGLDSLPPEFGLVSKRTSNPPAASAAQPPNDTGVSSNQRSSRREFVALASDVSDGDAFYGWLSARRAQRKAVLPTDVDPNQRLFAHRFAWTELTLCPALVIENSSDLRVVFTFVQKVC